MLKFITLESVPLQTSIFDCECHSTDMQFPKLYSGNIVVAYVRIPRIIRMAFCFRGDIDTLSPLICSRSYAVHFRPYSHGINDINLFAWISKHFAFHRLVTYPNCRVANAMAQLLQFRTLITPVIRCSNSCRDSDLPHLTLLSSHHPAFLTSARFPHLTSRFPTRSHSPLGSCLTHTRSRA